MKRAYLGDSYDAVKRLWSAALADWAPLYAEPSFLPSDIRSEFEKLTRVPVLSDARPPAYSVLNDPDTGIYDPGRPLQTVSRSHASLELIRMQLQDPRVRCVITFDQSKTRNAAKPASAQRAGKLSWLKQNGIAGFYYVSHAPFLFAAASEAALAQAAQCLERDGIPSSRLEYAA